jgi:thiamine transport system permease protein
MAALVAWRITPLNGFGSGLDRTVARWDQSRWDWIWLLLVTLFLVLPLAMILWRGVPSLPDLGPDIYRAAGRSVLVALAATTLTLAGALALSLRGGVLVALVGSLPLAASALVMGTGLFLLVFPFVNPVTVALPVTVGVNAVMAMPFALRLLSPAVADIRSDYGPLAANLALGSWATLRLVILPRLRKPLSFAAGLTMALSIGDLGVVALFATPAQETLPLAMYRLMGAYRMDAAAGAAVLLLFMALGAFWICDSRGQGDADAG